MKVSYKVLQKYVQDLPEVEQVAQDLIMHTAEVEEILYEGEHLKSVFIAEVLSCEKHPDSEKLNVCQVKVLGESKQIVCGAPNVKAGIKVPVATLGAELAADFVIAKTKIRGEVSEGMICSEDELGLVAERQAGILILPDDAPLDMCMRDYLGKNDAILEIDNKAINHRPDLFSHIGVARELAAMYNTPFDFTYITEDFSTLPNYPLQNTIPAAVRRYMALQVEGLENVAASQDILDALVPTQTPSKGLLVDVSNYSLYLYGQPTHCFDADTLQGNIVVRYARDGESFTGLDDKTYSLSAEDIVIADDVSVIALGGVMGAKHSAVSSSTTRIIIEVAHFDQALVRKTGKRLGIRTDSLNVFEKDILPDMAEYALALIVAQLRQHCPNLTLHSYSDSYEHTQNALAIEFDLERITALIGRDYEAAYVLDICQRLGITKDDHDVLHIPFWRKDLAYIADIAEEVARIDGYDHIEMSLPRIDTGAVIQDPLYKLKQEVREYLTACGFFDMYTYSFVGTDLMQKCGLDLTDCIPLKNSLSEDATHMRPALIPNLLLSLEKNRHDFDAIKLFELEKVFSHHDGQIGESYSLAAVMMSDKDTPYYDMQTQLSDLLARIGIYSYRYMPVEDAPAYAHGGRVAGIQIRGKVIGYVGEIHPRITDRFELPRRVSFFEIDADALASAMHTTIQAKEVSEFQQNQFDLNFVVEKDTSGSRIADAIVKSDPEIIQKVSLIDIYESDEHLLGKRSLTFKIFIQSMTETLDDSVKNALIDTIVNRVQKVGGTLRS